MGGGLESRCISRIYGADYHINGTIFEKRKFIEHKNVIIFCTNFA